MTYIELGEYINENNRLIDVSKKPNDLEHLPLGCQPEGLISHI
jgi:hypothetical protein